VEEGLRLEEDYIVK